MNGNNTLPPGITQAQYDRNVAIGRFLGVLIFLALGVGIVWGLFRGLGKAADYLLNKSFNVASKVDSSSDKPKEPSDANLLLTKDKDGHTIDMVTGKPLTTGDSRFERAKNPPHFFERHYYFTDFLISLFGYCLAIHGMRHNGDASITYFPGTLLRPIYNPGTYSSDGTITPISGRLIVVAMAWACTGFHFAWVGAVIGGLMDAFFIMLAGILF